MKVTELATELTLKTLLIELAQDGVRYAQLEKRYADENHRNLSGQAYTQLGAISNILASILPGVCPAQAQRGFIDFAATDVNPYIGMDMDDVEKLLAAIDVAWKKEDEQTPTDTSTDWMLPKTTFEGCQNCDNEVEIPGDERSKCPKCQEEIFPCSTCYKQIDGIKDCDWDEDTGCWRFPKTGRKEEA